jgi:hypothetical protein
MVAAEFERERSFSRMSARTNSLGVEKSVPSPEFSSRNARSSSVRERLIERAMIHRLPERASGP